MICKKLGQKNFGKWILITGGRIRAKIQKLSDDKLVKSEIELNDTFKTDNRSHIEIFNNMNGIKILSW